MSNLARVLAATAVVGLLALTLGFFVSLYIDRTEAEEAKRASGELEGVVADAQKDRVGKRDPRGETTRGNEEWWRVPASEASDADGFGAFFRRQEVSDALAQLAVQRAFGTKADQTSSLPADWDGAYSVALVRRHIIKLVGERWRPLRQSAAYLQLFAWLSLILSSVGLCWKFTQEIVRRASAWWLFQAGRHSLKSITVRAVVAASLVWVAVVWLWGVVADWSDEMTELQYVALMFGPPPLLALAVALAQWMMNPNPRSHG